MFQLIRLLQNFESKPRITLLYGNKSTEDIILKNELDSLAKNNDNLRICYFVDKNAESKEFIDGYITKEHIADSVSIKDEQAIVFVCGPDR